MGCLSKGYRITAREQSAMSKYTSHDIVATEVQVATVQ